MNWMSEANTAIEEDVVLHSVDARPDSRALQEWRERFQRIEALIRGLDDAEAPFEVSAGLSSSSTDP